MEGAALVGVLVGLAAYLGAQRIETGETAVGMWEQVEQTFSDGVAMLRLSLMRELDPALLADANLRAFLRVIRTGEGTADAGGYSRLFGGDRFEGFDDHPRIKVCRNWSGGRICSTAAGAYQFLASTWDETARIMGLPDFSPASQDIGALGRIAARGALPDVLAGRFEDALRKVAREWASMPGSPYGQPTITLAKAQQIYTAAGGSFA